MLEASGWEKLACLATLMAEAHSRAPGAMFSVSRGRVFAKSANPQGMVKIQRTHRGWLSPKVAVGAVLSEPVSGLISLFYRERTGNFTHFECLEAISALITEAISIGCSVFPCSS